MFVEEDYTDAMMEASGITLEQAKTCLYYCVATHLIPKYIDRMPILAIMGPQGTGKSCLLSQLMEFVHRPIRLETKSVPTLRDSLIQARTVIIDEGDNINEDYLIRRYSKETSQISFKRTDKGKGWRTVTADIFGATIIVRRTPFRDGATTSRAIIIRTRYRKGQYQNVEFGEKTRIRNIAKKIKDVEFPASTNRVYDVWQPLRIVAEKIGDKEWLEYSNHEIEKDIKNLRGSQNYEPELALILTLKEKMDAETIEGLDSSISISTIKADLKTEFDLRLKNMQIQEMCRSLGFKVVSHSGYPKVKRNLKLLE